MPHEMSRTPRTPRRRRVPLRPAFFLLLIFLGLFAYVFLQKTQEIHGLSAQVADLRFQNQTTAQQNYRLWQTIQSARTPRYVENAARSVGFARPGEVVVQVQPRHPTYVPVRRPVPVPAAPPRPVWK